jgi:hypothetical protein
VTEEASKSEGKTEIQVHKNALAAVLRCLIVIAVAIAPIFAEAGQPYPPSPGFTTAMVAGEKAPVPKLERSSLLEVEATNFQVAKHVMNDPHLFAFEVVFNSGFLQLGPENSGFTMSADYESPSDQVQYLAIGRLRKIYKIPEDSADLAEAPFLPPHSCYGNAPADPYVAPPAPEPESKHPPVEGWTVDLPQLWNIAKSHEALFANGLQRSTITTAARLREVDNKPQCGSSTIFDSAEWQGELPSGKPVKRLINEQGQRALIELVEYGLQKSQPPSSSQYSSCSKGHYLIIDAHSSDDLESGTYFLCASPVA